VRQYIVIRSKSKLKIVFPSDLLFLEEIVAESVDFLKTYNADVDMFSFKLALYEGFSNAVKHGNKNDPSLNVTFELVIDKEFLTIKIEDSGEGFDWSGIFENDRRDLYEPGGRGILLLEAYGFNPRYNEKGNVLFMKKIFGTEPSDDILNRRMKTSSEGASENENSSRG